MAESKTESKNVNLQKVEINKDSLRILKNLELVMIPINATTGVGLLLFMLAGPLNVFDLEIWGYFLMAFSILLSFFVLIGYMSFYYVNPDFTLILFPIIFFFYFIFVKKIENTNY